jgi:hypothetical protein
MKKLLVSLVLLCVAAGSAAAQCAMCRSTLENNYSNGHPGIASGINIGILYLLILPYLAAVTIWYFWNKSAKNAAKEFSERGA